MLSGTAPYELIRQAQMIKNGNGFKACNMCGRVQRHRDYCVRLFQTSGYSVGLSRLGAAALFVHAPFVRLTKCLHFRNVGNVMLRAQLASGTRVRGSAAPFLLLFECSLGCRIALADCAATQRHARCLCDVLKSASSPWRCSVPA